MTRTGKSDEGDRNNLMDGRAEWSRPAMHRLNVDGAENLQKVSMDGEGLGKGTQS